MKTNKVVFYNILKMVVVIILASALAYAFDAYVFAIENILLIYTIATIIVVLETRKLQYGIICGVINSVIYEFCFVEPKFSFALQDISSLMSIGFYLAVCVVISIMSFRLQSQIKKSQVSELLVKSTYDNSKSLLKAKNQDDIANNEVKILQEVLDKKVCICLKKRKNYILYGDDIVDVESNIDIFNYSLSYNIICGHKGQKYTHLKYKIYPLKSGKFNFGVIVIDCQKGDIKRNQKEYLKTNMAHIVMALERERLEDQKDDVKVKIENEELKNALILNFSGDLQKPIAEIEKECSDLFKKYNKLDKDKISDYLKRIEIQNKKMKGYTNQIINLSTLNSGEEIKNEKRVNIKNVINSTLELFENNFSEHTVNCDVEDANVLVDSTLMQETFENIISNALKYTPKGSTLNILSYISEGDVIIEFEDNGTGIDEDKLENIFETKEEKDKSNYKVGLNVCKKIVEAHNGKIKVYNNALGGLTVKITLKLEK